MSAIDKSAFLNYSEDDINYKIKNMELCKMIIHKQNNKKLYKYLGDIIYNFYKKPKLNKQSIWNSDVSRLNFIVRNKTNLNNIIWQRDPKGVQVKEKAIKPLLKIVTDLMRQFVTENVITNKMSIEEMRIITDRLTTANDIKIYAENTLDTDILRYIAPKFFLKKNETYSILSDESPLLEHKK